MDRCDSGGLQIGRHLFDAGRCELRSDAGRTVALGQRAGRLLQALVEAGGRVLSRDQLLERAWPGQDIPDGNLRVQIAALRRALAEDRALIGTVAGRGYLFAGTARRLAGPAAALAPLPPLPPSLIGRAALVDDVLARCLSTRFVTLAGAPGIGKSTVALGAAHRHADAVRRAVAWVELDAVTTEEGVLAAACAVLAAGATSLAALAAGIGSRHLLLVLDNCEHVAEAASRLVETLLGRCPGLAVLATSRQPLLAQGETVVRVPSLGVPEEGDRDPARLAACTAVQLFVARAMPGTGDGPALALVGALCRRLDGLPLALELAAAHVATLGLAGVAAGLEGALALPAGVAGVARPRHRTMRAALDWSHVLLPPPARLALSRLAALPSWFTLDDAAAQCHPDLCPYATIDSLACLAAHSLLVVEHAQPARYRLLATTRAYALSRPYPGDRHRDAG